MKLIILTALLLVVGASAQISNTERDTTSQEWQDAQVEGFSCKHRAAERFHAATEPTLSTEQDWNLKAGEAYLKLSEMGEKCE